ncbi:carboxymuconolactone decarboxylase family protein [Paremcibacter congregatus]|uniref:carboxymuconolactone decarboxylase family protein n=1 Tax=Paremcibacter congregatus TaxID=2043170 RepID=UPI003A8E5410
MSRINLVTNETATSEQKELFTAITDQLGMVPNFLKIFANSPVALRGFLGLYVIAGAGSLDALTKERIALAVAEQNACQYCVSAHSAIGRKAGLSNAEIEAARAGTSQDAKAAVAVKLAKSLAEHSGAITTSELLDAQNAGFTDADIVEIITHVGMNILTNMLNNASRVEIDFPKVALNKAA